MILNTLDKIASSVGVHRDTMKKYAKYLPVFGHKSKRQSYITTDKLLDFITKRVKEEGVKKSLPLYSIKDAIEICGEELFASTNLYEKKTQKAITVAFNNLKGGVAKTTTVANLGAVLASLNQKVLLVDMDMQNQLSTYFDNSTGIDLADDDDTRTIEELEKTFAEYSDEDIDSICSMVATEKFAKKSLLNVIEDFKDTNEVNLDLVDEIIHTADVGNGYTVDILPSEWKLGRGFEDIKGLMNVAILLRKILARAREKYDFILIDTSPANIFAIQLSFFASDYITLVSTPDQKAFQSFFNVLKEFDITKKVASEININIRLDSLILSRTKRTKSQVFWSSLYEYTRKKRNLNLYTMPEKAILSDTDTKNIALIAHNIDKEGAFDTIDGLIAYAIDLINRGE